MPTSQSSMRPSSTMSDENSDFEYDDDDDDDVEALDDGSGDEKSTEFIVPSIKRSNKEETETRKVVSNGVKKSVNDNELIICENSSSNSVGFGGSSAGFDPLDTDEKDPLDLQSAESNDVGADVVVPVIKLRASKDEGWKIKRKSDPVEPEQELPAKRVRTNRSIVSYVEIDDDDDDRKTKSRGRPRREVAPATPQPLKVPKSPPTKASQPTKSSLSAKAPQQAKASQPSKVQQPTKVSQPAKASQSTKSSPTTRSSQLPKAASPTKATPSQKTSTPVKVSLQAQKASKPQKVLPEKKEKPPPASAGKRGRRKRRDSEDSFEILPFKRRQFRGVEVDEDADANNEGGEDLDDAEDEETKDDVLRTSTPTPVETKTETRRSKASKKSSTVEDVKEELREVKEEESQPQPEETTNEPPSLNDTFEKIPKKRGRPRKSEQLQQSADVTLDTMSRDSFSSSLRQRKARMSVTNFSCLDDEETRMTFGFDDSTLDFFDFSDDADFKPAKRGQARPGPVKNIDQTFPRLTAEELVSGYLDQ